MKNKKILIIISAIITIIAILAVVVVYTRRNMDYKPTIKNSVNKYLISGNIDDLEDITKLLKSFQYDKSMINTINDYIYKEVGESMVIIDNLNTCDEENKIDCTRALNEFTEFSDKVDKLHTNKVTDKIQYIKDNDYNKIHDELSIKIVGIETLLETH